MPKMPASPPVSPEVDLEEVPAPTFLAPEMPGNPRRRPDPVDPTADNQLSGPNPPSDTGPGSGSPAAGKDPTTGSTASTDTKKGPTAAGSWFKSGRVDKAQEAAYTELVTVLLNALGGILHQTQAVDPDSDEWLPDSQDQETIAPPLARIAARHSSIGGDVSDITDLIQAAVGTAFYALKNLTKRAAARRLFRRRQSVQPPAPVDVEDQADQPAETTSAAGSSPAPTYVPAGPEAFGMAAATGPLSSTPAE